VPGTGQHLKVTLKVALHVQTGIFGAPRWGRCPRAGTADIPETPFDSLSFQTCLPSISCPNRAWASRSFLGHGKLLALSRPIATLGRFLRASADDILDDEKAFTALPNSESAVSKPVLGSLPSCLRGSCPDRRGLPTLPSAGIPEPSGRECTVCTGQQSREQGTHGSMGRCQI
jgi:hypothetical protein